MITIRYSTWGSKQEQWKEKLEGLVVSHRFEKDEALTAPALREREREVEGEAAIEAFLKQLEKDMDDWRTPRCGV